MWCNAFAPPSRTPAQQRLARCSTICNNKLQTIRKAFPATWLLRVACDSTSLCAETCNETAGGFQPERGIHLQHRLREGCPMREGRGLFVRRSRKHRGWTAGSTFVEYGNPAIGTSRIASL
jgi:hypothetical protein